MAAPVQDAYGNYQPGGAISSGAIAFGGKMVPMFTGSVNPNGVVTAPIGSLYNQIANGALVTSLFKITGQNTNTGWQ